MNHVDERKVGFWGDFGEILTPIGSAEWVDVMMGQVGCDEVYSLAVIMSSQVPSTYSRLTNASARLTHRRIFPQPAPSPAHGNDLHRIAAKIRELEDDVRAILGENTQVEEDNRQLINILEQVEFVVSEQQSRMDELTLCLERDAEAGETIAQYEQDLGTVAEQICTLNELIQNKNEQFDQLRAMKEEELYRNMRLKEQSNHLLYEHNALLHELDQLADEEEEISHHSPSFHEDPQEKLQAVFASCEQLASRVQDLRVNIEQTRREGNERAGLQKEKRIRLEYEVRLLRERKSDQAKKEGYLKGFYDEERIQSVIDDMLQKEDSLRSQIAEQEEATREAVVEWEEQLQSRRKNGARERLQREEEGKLLQLQISALQGEVRESLMRLTEVTQRLEVVEREGIEMEKFQENMDSEIYHRIKAVEQQNLLLQVQHEELSASVQQLQDQLTHIHP